MTQTDESVPVTLQLPKLLYQQASETADGEHCQVEDFLSQLVVQALQNYDAYKLWESVSEQYRERLAKEDRLNQPPDEVLSELSKVREEIAHELYPG
mgnify:CR=1 FL=1